MLADYEFEINGLELKIDDGYIVEDPDGLFARTIRTDDHPRSLRDGTDLGPDFVEGKAIVFAITVLQSDREQLLELLSALSMAWEPGDTILRFAHPAGTRRVYGRPRRFLPNTASIGAGEVNVQAEFVLGDPLQYDDELSTVEATEPFLTGGLSWPHAWPHGWGAAGPGAATLENAGDTDTFMAGVVTAITDIEGFAITNVDTGELFSMTTPMLAGQTMALDFAARTVLLNGRTTRAAHIDRPQSTWFSLPPGETTVDYIPLLGEAALALSWRSAWR